MCRYSLSPIDASNELGIRAKMRLASCVFQLPVAGSRKPGALPGKT
jgi:hypothetical protein